ncbi:MAG: class I SAM-dependent methyltransferase [Thermodesulfobacteriota bacterium]|nr:class I SAM-dependent methyltransferase [Thermodesulfobacteriota bacterium]
MFAQLEEINSRPEPFEFYTAADLWTDEHTSEQMLAYHLNGDIDVSSRRGAFIDQSVEWMASHFNIGPDTRIADFGCGPGLYAKRLAGLGAIVTGVDFSQRSIEYARGVAADTGLAVEYVDKNYLEFETEWRFDLVLMIMCDLCALSPSQRTTMLKKFHSLLFPGGSVLLDVYSMNAFKQREEATSYGVNLLGGFWSAEKYYGFLNTFKYDDAKVVLDKYTIVEADRIRTIYNWLQYFSPASLRQEFEEAGFTQHELYGDVAGTPFDETATEFAIVGKK